MLLTVIHYRLYLPILTMCGYDCQLPPSMYDNTNYKPNMLIFEIDGVAVFSEKHHTTV